jgi:hypothetical protein
MLIASGTIIHTNKVMTAGVSSARGSRRFMALQNAGAMGAGGATPNESFAPHLLHGSKQEAGREVHSKPLLIIFGFAHFAVGRYLRGF